MYKTFLPEDVIKFKQGHGDPRVTFTINAKQLITPNGVSKCDNDAGPVCDPFITSSNPNDYIKAALKRIKRL